jgi:hypothetical protein
MEKHNCWDNQDVCEEETDAAIIITTFCTVCEKVLGTKVLSKEVEGEYD